MMPPETTSPETPLPEPVTAPERFPFWGFQDLLVMAGLVVPCFLVAAAIVNLGFGVNPEELGSRAVPVLASQFLFWAFWFVCLWFLLRARYERAIGDALRWGRPRRSMVTFVLLGVMQAFAIALLGLLLRTPDIAMPMKDLLSDRLSLILVGSFAVTLGPVAEELAFRGFLLPLLVRPIGAVPAVALASGLFARLHGAEYGWSWQPLLLISIAGCCCAAVRVLTGSTAAAAAVHAGYNLTFFVAYLTHWEEFAS